MKEELEEILKDLVYDGKINNALTSIINLVDKEVIGEDYPKDYPYDDPEAIKYFNIEKERQRAKLKGVSNENINT